MQKWCSCRDDIVSASALVKENYTTNTKIASTWRNKMYGRVKIIQLPRFFMHSFSVPFRLLCISLSLSKRILYWRCSPHCSVVDLLASPSPRWTHNVVWIHHFCGFTAVCGRRCHPIGSRIRTIGERIVNGNFPHCRLVASGWRCHATNGSDQFSLSQCAAPMTQTRNKHKCSFLALLWIIFFFFLVYEHWARMNCMRLKLEKRKKVNERTDGKRFRLGKTIRAIRAMADRFASTMQLSSSLVKKKHTERTFWLLTVPGRSAKYEIIDLAQMLDHGIACEHSICNGKYQCE